MAIDKIKKKEVSDHSTWSCSRGAILVEDDVYFEETMLRGFIIGMATLKEDDVELAKKNWQSLFLI